MDMQPVKKTGNLFCFFYNYLVIRTLISPYIEGQVLLGYNFRALPIAQTQILPHIQAFPISAWMKFHILHSPGQESELRFPLSSALIIQLQLLRNLHKPKNKKNPTATCSRHFHNLCPQHFTQRHFSEDSLTSHMNTGI